MENINAISNLSLDNDLSYFESKIKNKKMYVESLKSAAEQGMDPAQWFQSVIENMNDLLDSFILCKNKLQFRAKPHAITVSHQPINSEPPVSPPAVDLEPIIAAPKVLLPSPTRGPLDAPALALRDAENQCSIVVMNLPEYDTLEDVLKRQSDLENVRKILSYVGLDPYIRNIIRFKPTLLPPGRPAFLKVCFASGEVKKNVLETLLANNSRIRALDTNYSRIVFTDPDKSTKVAVNDNLVSTDNKPAATFGSGNSKHVKFNPNVEVKHFSETEIRGPGGRYIHPRN